MITPNRHYPLPHKFHDVVDDINDLRSTFRMIDDDVKNTEERIEELSGTVSDLENRAVHLPYSVENSEIQNISANRYLVVNQNGDGFECLDGGGDAGGELGQCSIKKTDSNFDTAWGNILEISKNGMTPQENSETSQANETHIYVDEAEIENDEQLSKVELTNCQAKSDFNAENNSSVIFCDGTEEIEEEIQIATRENFGLVKIGDGFSNNAGTISAPIISKATENNFGIIKIGDGLVNNNGTISRDELNPATFSNFGIVKLGDNLSINSAGEMEIGNMASNATIYSLGNIKICNNGIIDLEEQTLQYRMFVTEDLVVQFRTDFEVQDDFSFVLEIVSDGTHLISFNENLNPKMSTLPINRGITKLTFSKKLGVPSYDVEISRLDAPEPTLLTPNYGDDINSNLMVTHNGSDWSAHDQLKSSTDNVNFFGREFYFEFSSLVVGDYVYFTSQYSEQSLSEFCLKASNDKQNWTTLIYRKNESVNGNIFTELKGCFRYYKLYIGWQNSNYPRSMQLWGTKIDNNESELILLTPRMASDVTSWGKLTYSKLNSGSASDLTDVSLSSSIYVQQNPEDAEDLDYWIKYEFTEPQVANFLDVGGTIDYLDRTMRWYKLEGSNDNENWTLLLERQYQRDFYKFETRWHEFENTTAYKFYKLTCLANSRADGYWRIGRVRLFRKDSGRYNFYRGVPKLTEVNQDGYEISASSEYDSNHAAKYAFDGDVTTKWAVSGNGVGAWLQIKLPTATIFNAFQLASRGDGNYNTQAPKDFEMQGSNDGETWMTLTTLTDISWSQGEYKTFRFINTNAYLYYRLYINANNGAGDTGIGELVLGNSIHDYKRHLHQYTYLVPILTSNTSASGYVASASSEYSNDEGAWRVFDRQASQWTTRYGTNRNVELKITLPEAQKCDFIVLETSDANSRIPQTFRIEASNDDSNWTVLYQNLEGANLSTYGNYRYENPYKNTAFKYYRLYILTNKGDGFISLRAFQLVRETIIQEY